MSSLVKSFQRAGPLSKYMIVTSGIGGIVGGIFGVVEAVEHHKCPVKSGVALAFGGTLGGSLAPVFLVGGAVGLGLKKAHEFTVEKFNQHTRR